MLFETVPSVSERRPDSPPRLLGDGLSSSFPAGPTGGVHLGLQTSCCKFRPHKGQSQWLGQPQGSGAQAGGWGPSLCREAELAWPLTKPGQPFDRGNTSFVQYLSSMPTLTEAVRSPAMQWVAKPSRSPPVPPSGGGNMKNKRTRLINI